MEAIWRVEVENFPAFIVVDNKGNDFFKEWQTEWISEEWIPRDIYNFSCISSGVYFVYCFDWLIAVGVWAERSNGFVWNSNYSLFITLNIIIKWMVEFWDNFRNGKTDEGLVEEFSDIKYLQCNVSEIQKQN